MTSIQAYCMKCREKREMRDPEPVYMKNGAAATRGTCPVCGTALYKAGATELHAGMTKPTKPAASAQKAAATTTAATSSAKTSKTKTASKTAAKGKTSKTSKAATKKAAASKESQSETPSAKGKLVIVESPAKARSVGKFLGRGYTVKASKGHVRDLLATQLSVDVKNDFEPKYRVPNDKRDVVSELKAAVNQAGEIYLATDPDREGEAIAWHLIAAAAMEGKKIKRVVFHEITKPAIQEAFSHPRDLDLNLVNAQQARRILDRLVGYNITELLWQKVRGQLSAGRVQSIALRMIVDREREIDAFQIEEYWTLDAKLKKHKKEGIHSAKQFLSRLVKVGSHDAHFGREDALKKHLPILEKSQYVVKTVKHGTRQRNPSAPFTTSTLQQEASRRFGMGATRTMMLAQQLYEGIELGAAGTVGLITYMRTDSTNVSEIAQQEARGYIEKRFGADYRPAKAPRYQTRTKGAQEAHEAVRPTSVLREPEQMRGFLDAQQFKLYTLIWQRFVASQMSSAVYNTLRVDINAEASAKEHYTFRVSGSTVKFDGFMALYEDSRDEDIAPDADEGRILPDLAQGDVLDLLGLLPEQHFTQPPPRYTEATLVRALEEFGIGRPSTYAPIVAKINERDYVEKHEKRLQPTDTGKTVSDLLTQYFPKVMDYQFTAHMEDELDSIAEGDLEWRPMLHNFYQPFAQQLETAYEVIPRSQQVEEIGRNCPESGHPLVIRYGRFGKFIGCSNYPECRYTERWLDRLGVSCPKCGKEHGGEMTAQKSKKGRAFYGCSRYPECDFVSWRKPLPQPCPHCGGMLVEANRTRAQCDNCKRMVQLSELADLVPEPT